MSKKMDKETEKKKMDEKWKMLEQTLNDDKMTSTALAVYTVIWKYHNINYGYAHPTRKQLCKLANVSIPTLDRALKTLVDTGHIKIKSGKKTGKNTLYYLIDKPVETVETIEEWEVPYYYESEGE